MLEFENFISKISCFTRNIIDNTMTYLSIKKQKNSLLAKKKFYRIGFCIQFDLRVLTPFYKKHKFFPQNKKVRLIGKVWKLQLKNKAMVNGEKADDGNKALVWRFNLSNFFSNQPIRFSLHSLFGHKKTKNETSAAFTHAVYECVFCILQRTMFVDDWNVKTVKSKFSI